MPNLLPEYSRAIGVALEGIRSITWEKWLWAAAPFAAALVQPLTRRLFPDWGDGPHLITGTATRGTFVGQHLWKIGTPLVTAVVVGLTLISQSAILPSLAVLAAGIGGAVYLSLDHRRARTNVRFSRNRFRFNGVGYRYSDIASIAEGTPEGTKLLRWKKFEVRLSRAEYEILRPSLLRQGYGENETVSNSDGWNLR